MVTQEASSWPGKVRVTFRIPTSAWADRVWLVGDFYGVGPCTIEMEQDSGDPTWHVSLDLPTGSSYRYAYLIDGSQWTIEAETGWEEGQDGPRWGMVETASPIQVTWIRAHDYSDGSFDPSDLQILERLPQRSAA